MGEVVISSENDVEVIGTDDMELQTEIEAGEKNKEIGAAAAASSSIVRWERFLPKMVFRVLLVEADDSTRQIITALLRKCSYKVAAVADGLKAWELLKGRPHNIDLILTEVDLPSVSGYALLSLIMEHEICKNIPVIMMSSNDSVSTVYRCMLRGAADFLVKPVRKNELKNLWQHVWRRRAASVSSQGPLDESVAQQKVEATAENNASSNHSSGYKACVQRNRECIEKGSDAQSSCTKPELENERENTEDLQESIQPNRTASLPNGADLRKELFLEANNRLIMSVNDAGAPLEDANTMTRGEDTSSDDNWGHVRTIDQTSDENPGPLTKQAIDLIGAFDNYLKCNFKSSGSNVRTNKADSSSPQLDLSLTRPHQSGSVNQFTNEKQRLNHSDASAFTRYVNRAMQSGQSTSSRTYNQQDYETDSDKQFPGHAIDYNSDARAAMTRPHSFAPPSCGEPGPADIGHPSPQQRVTPLPIPVRGIRFEGPSSAYSSMIAPILRMPSGISPLQCPGSATPQESSYQANPFLTLNCEGRSSQQLHSQSVQNNSGSTTYNEGKREHWSEPKIDCRYLPSATDQSTNSSCCNGGLNQVHMSFGSSGNISLPIVKTPAECWKEEISYTPDGNSNRSQREAALTKFRQKRKDRCFEKKVRYESRKKLAEQRPRVKGQFVRQVPNEPQMGNS
ncbi:PREDICTED: two-component response regulator-like APRR9 [Nicotiana attenuata]|uniref:Two-component response regulator-like aprr5 n=1 Tax=Nicotiana attenuata TaxID=49451 RepID=A0A1J6IKA7_NICAT|nr:PREDICTED: two-component response regulator-like APRR9 [Nicotiana attenuata]OIT04716.1 two-component response regulator-like aprr5 [Nicotiana attenuata]